jgi:hypothetical protein
MKEYIETEWFHGTKKSGFYKKKQQGRGKAEREALT